MYSPRQAMLDSAGILGYVACALHDDSASVLSFPMRVSLLTYAGILFAVAVWCGGIILAPICTAAGGDAAVMGQALMQFYHPICHQLPDRSIFVSGYPMGVCVRCSSIYFAFLGGTLLFPLVRRLAGPPLPPLWVLAVAAVPMLIDATWIGSWFYPVTLLTRAASGAVFGLALPFVLLPAALEASREFFSDFHQQKGFSDA